MKIYLTTAMTLDSEVSVVDEVAQANSLTVIGKLLISPQAPSILRPSSPFTGQPLAVYRSQVSLVMSRGHIL